jgi:hypothetical protein
MGHTTIEGQELNAVPLIVCTELPRTAVKAELNAKQRDGISVIRGKLKLGTAVYANTPELRVVI